MLRTKRCAAAILVTAAVLTGAAPLATAAPSPVGAETSIFSGSADLTKQIEYIACLIRIHLVGGACLPK
ncbi:hypothetical protein NBRGN_054_00990 [Nocardia brasiliensis NBRC 14402]|uniref:hypothetical protein n=1 Tax=Nocardia brasiliensis TaxID=37326 RepID=UPI0002E95A2C|nr:hypothetical protein [Nocardia brasiliensis]ASF06277.1 hypothetical protein CEQ30_01785 [Nocardia brasiliensis]GAJ82394.1 hypothetical protein NBRGN_054_00990 [Nocardia brasiliensis NBRC 14402]SUB53975.1 Uncharacterised protein [Nocardia brasiliensis]